MSLSDFSTVIVSGDGPALTQVGFGTMLIAAGLASSVFPERTRVIESTADLTDLSISTTSPVYLAVQRALAQSPRPSPLKIGRLENIPTQKYRLTPVAANATIYAFTVQLQGKSAVDITVTSDSDATVDKVCDALATAIMDLDDTGEALDSVTVVSVGGTGATGGTSTAIEVTAPAAGVGLYISDWNTDRIKLEDVTADPGIAADLDAIRNSDGDWYGLALAHNGKAMIEEAADWAETQDVIFGANTSDWRAYDLAETTDIQSVLDAKSYARTFVIYDETTTAGFAGVAAIAERMPFDPGAPPSAGGDFNGKTLAGVLSNPLSPSKKSNLRSKGYTVYITTAGRAHTLGGDACGGKPIDQTRFEDWFRIRLQEDIAAMTLNNDRIPYNARGLAMYETVCRGRIQAGLLSGGISPVDEDGNAPSISIPKIGDIPSNDRAARVLGGPGIVIEFAYAGAIRKANVAVFVKL